MASFVAYMTPSPPGFGRSAAAVTRERADRDATEPFPQLIGPAEAEMAELVEASGARCRVRSGRRS